MPRKQTPKQSLVKKAQTEAADQLKDYHKHLDEYRSTLVTFEQKSQDDFDKTIIALSSGSLGVSISFIHDYLGAKVPIQNWLLLIAWILWSSSLISVLVSFYTSRLAHRYTINQVDKGVINEQRPGGRYDQWTNILNKISGLLYIVGITFFLLFVIINWR